MADGGVFGTISEERWDKAKGNILKTLEDIEKSRKPPQSCRFIE
jgi:hypothetical protein